MRLTLKLILLLVLVISTVAFGFSFWQARQEETRLKNELERRASIMADSLKESIEPLLSRNSIDSVNRIVSKFSNRERLLGVSIHDAEGKLIAASTNLQSELEGFSVPLDWQDKEVADVGYGQFMKAAKLQAHAYSVPLLNEDKVTHVLTLFHDRAYITE